MPWARCIWNLLEFERNLALIVASTNALAAAVRGVALAKSLAMSENAW
jgi:short subunit fatty acids transporter